jgi:hypothetical protein
MWLLSEMKDDSICNSVSNCAGLDHAFIYNLWDDLSWRRRGGWKFSSGNKGGSWATACGKLYCLYSSSSLFQSLSSSEPLSVIVISTIAEAAMDGRSSQRWRRGRRPEYPAVSDLRESVCGQQSKRALIQDSNVWQQRSNCHCHLGEMGVYFYFYYFLSGGWIAFF